jgi:hypothetical protein
LPRRRGRRRGPRHRAGGKDLGFGTVVTRGKARRRRHVCVGGGGREKEGVVETAIWDPLFGGALLPR